MWWQAGCWGRGKGKARGRGVMPVADPNGHRGAPAAASMKEPVRVWCVAKLLRCA